MSHHPRHEYSDGAFSLLWALYDTSGVRNLNSLHGVLKSTVEFGVAKLSTLAGWHFPAQYPWYQKLAMLSGQYEKAAGDVVARLLKPGMNCVDGGAHVGYFSLMFSRLSGPGGVVYAFEPHPENFALLVQNAKKAEYPGIFPLQMALSDKSDNLEFFESTSSREHSIYKLNKKATGKIFSAKAITLDEFLAEKGNPHVNLLKLDVEGAEWAVLKGCSQLLKRSNKLALMLEMSPVHLSRAGVDASDVLKFLRSYGFHIRVIKWAGECTEIDDHSLISYARETEYVNILAQKGS